MRGLEAAASRALEAVLAAPEKPSSSALVDQALTLHMLQGHAPRFFARYRLSKPLRRSMRALATVPRTFEAELPWFELMARVDALYLRRVRRRPTPPFSRWALARAIEQVFEEGHQVLGWLLGQLGERLGVVSRRRPGLLRYPARPFDWELHLYQLTHEVLLATDYLRRPLPRGALSDTLDTLAASVSDAVEAGWADLLGEVVFCLQAGGRPCPQAALDVLIADPAPSRDHREALHREATRLVALAGALDRGKSTVTP